MIKLELNQPQQSPINFEDLDVGETFLVKNDDIDECWIGMKVADLCDYEPRYYIMDLSECVGELYEDWQHPDYKIVKILDLTLKEEN